MTSEQCIGQLKATKEYLDRSTRCLEEKHESFSPADGMFTTANKWPTWPTPSIGLSKAQRSRKASTWTSNPTPPPSPR